MSCRQKKEKRTAQFKVIQPQLIGRLEPTTTNLGEKGGKTGHETDRASPSPPQKGRRVGGEENRGSSRILLPKSITSKRQARPGAGMTRLPASPLPPHPPPRHLIPSQLDSAPGGSVFLENEAPPKNALGRGDTLGPPPIGHGETNRTSWHRQQRCTNRHVAASRNHAPATSRTGEVGVGAGVIPDVGRGASLSKSPPPAPSSLPSSSFPPHPPPLPGNTPPPPPPPPSSLSNHLPLDFEETVCLVASCAAAATAAALSSQRVSLYNPLSPHLLPPLNYATQLTAY